MGEDIISHFRYLYPPVTASRITDFEHRYNLVMPHEIRQFYLVTNGGIPFRHDIYKEGEYFDYIYNIAGLGGVESSYEGIARNNRDVGYIIKESACIMPIAHTAGRNSIFIGHFGQYKDQVYISGDLDDETGIIPITRISGSFTEFLSGLQ